METLRTDLRDELIEALNNLVAHTEEIYLNLARSYPLLLAETERSLDNSRSMISNVDDESTGETNRNGRATSIESLITQTRTLIEQGSKTFQQMHTKDGELFSALDEGIHKLSSLDDVIGNIKEDSIEMELISLNAMTVALKAGSAGRAFSYITEELKRLSSRTIALTEEITRRGEELLRVFHDFRSSLSEIKEFQERLFSELHGRLDTSFLDFQEGVHRTISVLSSISERSAGIRKPLVAVMEEIQLQDVIKQSVDHVIISLKELSASSAFETVEERLDELAFYQQLPALCHVLLEDISTKINRSLSVFRSNLAKARTIIREVERDRSGFVASRTGSDTAQGESLNALFDRSAAVLKGLLSDLSQSMAMKEQLTERSRNLMNEVFRLEDDFKSFSIVINRFHSIDIASRIEVVKQNVLQKMSGTVEEMTALIVRIERDVNESLNSIKVFIKTISATVNEFRNVFKEEELFVADFEKSIHSRYDQLFEKKNSVTDTIAGFSLFTGNFMSMFDATSGDLARLEQLIADVGTVRASLDEVKRITESEMKALLEQKGLRSWQIGSEKLQQIIQRFTIFTHKRTAGELAGFEVEGGVESGSVTLF
ncbi:MAG TPA: hypothetical protein VMW73_01725 [Spirochaetia bacterium]|nr:hypothetical protein [Spirochaetia bacterium]